MNQDSNTNPSSVSSDPNQQLQQEHTNDDQAEGQVSPEINSSINTRVPQSTPSLQVENHEVPKQNGGKSRIIKILGALIIIIIILSVISYLIYNFFIKDKYVTQTNNENAADTEIITENIDSKIDENTSWSTYLNTVYGYTIDYPETWATKVVADGATGEATINSNSFDIYDPTSSETYPVGVATFQVLEQEPFYDDSWEASEVTFNEVPMKKYVSLINDKMTSETYLIDLGGENYLEIVFRYEEGDGNKEVFDKMINSFTMLGSESQPDATNVIDDEGNAYEGDFGEF